MTASNTVVNDIDPVVQYTATSGQTIFDAPWLFFDDDDLTVYQTLSGATADDTADLLVLTTDYAVTNTDTESGGTIVLNSGAATGDTITIYRIVSLDRLADYQSSGDMLAETLNREQDTEIMALQQLRSDFSRSLSLKRSEAGSVSPVLPSPEGDAIIGWKTDLSGLKNINLVDGALIADGQLVIFTTVSDMKADISGLLVPGINVLTQGYTVAGDGGGALYLCASSQVTDGYGDHDAANGNALLIQNQNPIDSQYGIIGDGVVDDTDALAAYDALGKCTITKATILSDTQTLSANYTFEGGKIKPDTSQTITMTGLITANEVQIFDISVGDMTATTDNTTKEVSAAWFGYPVDVDVSTDSQPLLQATIDFAQEADAIVTLPINSDAKIASAVTFKQGQSATDAKRYHVLFDGRNALIRPDFDGDAISIIPRCLNADKATGRSVGSIDFKNLTIDGYFVTTNNHTSAQGLVIGASGVFWNNTKQSNVSDILIENFLTPPFILRNGRHCAFNKIVCRGATQGGLLVNSLENGEFTGDILLSECEFTGTSTKRPIELIGYAASGMAQVRGVRFRDCVTYGSGTYFAASDNSQVGDIWMENCAWDGPDAPATEDVIEILAADTGQIFQIFFDEPYIVNFTGRAIYTRSNGTGTVYQVSVRGGSIRTFDSAGLSIIDFISCENGRVSDVDFRNNIAASEIRASSSTHILVHDNDSQGSTITQMILLSAASDDVSVLGNVAQTTTVVTDATSPSAVNIQNANNLSVTT